MRASDRVGAEGRGRLRVPVGRAPPPSKPKRGSGGGGGGASSACPPGLIYMLSRPVRGGRTPGARSLAAGAARTLAPGLLPPPLGARREPDEREAREGAPGLSLSLWPPFLPAAGPPGAMLTLGKLRTALGGRGGGGARVWHLRRRRGEVAAGEGGGGWLEGERPGLPDQGGGGGGSEPKGSAGSCLSSCFSSHPERSSQKGAPN